MKTTITIQDGDVRLQLSPETDIEKMTMRELGDEISVSRSHESMVLRPRAQGGGWFGPEKWQGREPPAGLPQYCDLTVWPPDPT